MSSKNRMAILIILISVCCLMAAMHCSGKKPGEADTVAHEDIRGDCMGLMRSSSATADSGNLVLEVSGNDLHIQHVNAYYQCCLVYAVDYEIQGYDITALEMDNGDRCRCDCFFNLESILYELNPGMYTVTLIGVNGGTVGIDSAYVGE